MAFPYPVIDYSPEELTKIFNTDKREETLIGIAQFFEDTPKEILEELSQSESVNIRLAVAKNTKAPKEVLGEILEKLTRDPNPEVRKQAVLNHKTPDHALAAVLDNNCEDVLIRFMVTKNAGASSETLRKAWQLIKRKMKESNESSRIDKKDIDRALLNLAENPNTSDAVLIQIACLNRKNLEYALLSSGRHKVLSVLFDSKFPSIRESAKDAFKRLYVKEVANLKEIDW